MPPNMTKIIESEVTEFKNLALLVKTRIEQQKTPNEEGANSALNKLVESFRQALTRTLQAAVIELLPEEKEIPHAIRNMDDVKAYPKEAEVYDYNLGYNAAIADMKRRAEGVVKGGNI